MESGDTNLVQVVGATEYWAWEQEPSEDQVDAEDQQIDLDEDVRWLMAGGCADTMQQTIDLDEDGRWLMAGGLADTMQQAVDLQETEQTDDSAGILHQDEAEANVLADLSQQEEAEEEQQAGLAKQGVQALCSWMRQRRLALQMQQNEAATGRAAEAGGRKG